MKKLNRIVFLLISFLYALGYLATSLMQSVDANQTLSGLG